MNRRGFLKSSIVTSAGTAIAYGFEEKALIARENREQDSVDLHEKELPQGKIGNMKISRLVCGGNLISGFAHSRDLIYVSSLLKHYFSDEKIMETLELCEENGINTAILRVDDHILRNINKYRHERGGQIQWIAQAKLPSADWKADICAAVDNGANAVYIHGGVAEDLIDKEQAGLLVKAIETIKGYGVPAGIAGHRIEVPEVFEKLGIPVDFYMKTLNARNYWSAGPVPRNDSVWEETPEKTIAFMQNVKKPWIAYKVLGAGAIPPREGFEYAFKNGADFICVGMFDFQVIEDAGIVSDLLSGSIKRQRSWMA